METLTTAGVDTKLCSYVVSDFSKRRPQVWYPWPSLSPISTASNQILSMQRYDQVELYQLEKENGTEKSVRKSSSALIGTIAIETQSNLVSSTLSPNGQWLALCNATSLFVFRLEFSDGLVKPQKVTLAQALERLSVVALHFHGNTLFVADSSHMIHIVDLQDASMPHFTIAIQTEGKETLPIQAIHTSEDGNYLVTLSRLCEYGIHIFKRKGSSYLHHWTIPSLAGERPAALTLIQNNQVAVATFTNQVYLFDLEKQKLSPWSEQHAFPIRRWPSEMTSRKEFPNRLTVNPSDPTQLFLVSSILFLLMYYLVRQMQGLYYCTSVFRSRVGLSPLQNEIFWPYFAHPNAILHQIWLV
jgi:WD40 repeat protein